MTIQYRTPVRNNVPQLITYTFKDETQTIINLTGYTEATVEVKQQGQTFAGPLASFVSPMSSGQVQTTWTFISPGIWNIQFVVSDPSGNLFYGEPIQILVVPNVDDLTANQLPAY